MKIPFSIKKGQKEQEKRKEYKMRQEMNLYDDSLYNAKKKP